MRIVFNFKSFIFLLLFIFSLFLLFSVNAITYILTKVVTIKDKQNAYEAIISNFRQYFEKTIIENEKFLDLAINIIDKEKNLEKKKNKLKEIMNLYPFAKYVIVFDREGFIKEMYPFRRDALNLYMGNTALFKNIEKAKFSGPYVFLFDRKSYYAQSKKFGDSFALMLVDIPNFNNYLKELNENGYVSFIVDETGKIIAHYDEKYVNEGANIKMLIPKLNEISETQKPTEFIMDGEKYLLYSKFCTCLYKYIFIGNKYEKAFAEYNAFKKQLFSLFIFFTFLSLGLSLLISSFLQKPVLELFRIINNIKKQNYDVKAKPLYFQETNTLAENIIEMGRTIAEREVELSKLFETSRDAIVFSTLDGKLLNINPQGLKIFGYKDKNQIESVTDFYYNIEDRKRILEQIIKEGYVESFELKLKRADGSLFYGLLSSSLVRDEKGNPLFLISTVKDITEKIKMQEQLFQSQKMESIGRLAGSIAHDLNNMLTVISSNNQLIQLYNKDNEKIKKYTEGIANSVDKTKDFIKKLLGFSRRQVFEFSSYDINEVIKEEIKLLKPTIREDIIFSYTLYPEPLYVNLDRTQFTQILLNLVVNAIDAMPNGGDIKIQVERKKIDREIYRVYSNLKEGDFVCISFSDTGHGIPEEIRDKIFEPFFTTKEKGTGLGLSTVYSIVEQHKGFINVYSEVGVGTTFKIYFPLVETKTEKVNSKIEEIQLEKKRILLVEDQDEVRAGIEELLNKYGFEVHSISSALELLERFDEYRDKFDICLSDIIMPKMNGVELYRRLKKVKPDIKFIFMTGYANNIEQVNELIKEGLSLLSKPFTIHEFLEKIRQLD